jgi:hypothetical protein
MGKIFYPTDKVKKVESIFLGGTIDMGNSVDWQKSVIESLEKFEVDIFNPRRSNWDSSWEQIESNPEFNHQVTWELSCLEKADLIVIYFAPNSQSPITLLETGIFHKKNMIVCCPEGFYRKGNIDIVCTRYKVPKVESIDALIAHIEAELKKEI